MRSLLDIITVTKDDAEGVLATVSSTQGLRSHGGVSQLVIDSSSNSVREHLGKALHDQANVDYRWQAPSGIAAAFNLGIQQARGDWCWFLNGKDIVHPSLRPELLLQILQSTRADVIIFEHELMQTGRRPQHPPIWAQWPLLNGNWVPHPATIIRTELFTKFGGFSAKYKIAMDEDWWNRVFSTKVLIDLLSFPVVLYDEGGISTVNVEARVREKQQVLSENFQTHSLAWLRSGFWLLRARFPESNRIVQPIRRLVANVRRSGSEAHG